MADEPVDVEDVFDWDDGNIDKNLVHGVQDWEIEEALLDSDAIIVEQQVVNAEVRNIALGRSKTSGKYLRIVFTFRQRGTEELTRPISAVEMSPSEQRRYRG